MAEDASACNGRLRLEAFRGATVGNGRKLVVSDFQQLQWVACGLPRGIQIRDGWPSACRQARQPRLERALRLFAPGSAHEIGQGPRPFLCSAARFAARFATRFTACFTACFTARFALCQTLSETSFFDFDKRDHGRFQCLQRKESFRAQHEIRDRTRESGRDEGREILRQVFGGPPPTRIPPCPLYARSLRRPPSHAQVRAGDSIPGR